MKYTLITLAALSGSAFAQTIVNGDFSDTSGMTEFVVGGGAVHTGLPNGWTSDNGSVQVLTTSLQGNPAGFSSNYLDVADISQVITLSQQVSGFTAGQQYTLSYEWGNKGAGPYDMTISMGGVSDSHKGTGFVAASNNSYTFTADNATQTLSITFNHTNGDTSTGFNSTNFKVTPVNPVPEPSSAALLGLGGLALILRRRK